MGIAAIIFIILMFVVAYIAFRILKRTVKMAFRAIIVLIIFAIAIAGGLAIWNLDSFGFGKKTDTTKKSR